MSASLVFLDTDIDVYGVINDSGLELAVVETRNSDVPGVDFSLSDSFAITLNETEFTADTKFTFSFSLNLDRYSVTGINLGSYDGTSVKFINDLSLTATYSITDWHDDGLNFFANVDVNVLGFDIGGQVTLDASITNISQLPNRIESWIEDEVVSDLKDAVNPLKNKDLEKLLDELKNIFNLWGSDIMNVLFAAGHDIVAIASAFKDYLGVGMDEVASGLLDLGNDVSHVADAIGSVFNATQQEVVSGLIAAGVAVEHAVSTVFGEAGDELKDGFGFVGSSITSLATDAVDAVESFVTDDVAKFADQTLSDVGNFLEGAGEAIAHVFSSCEIM